MNATSTGHMPRGKEEDLMEHYKDATNLIVTFRIELASEGKVEIDPESGRHLIP